MVLWKRVSDIGHTAVMLPMAAAIAAWLIAGRAWKMALWWCAMFGAGLSLVALSKVAFLGWDVSMPSLGFKALSGHAFCASAVLPVLFFVVLQGSWSGWRTRGMMIGVLVSVGVGILLVHFEYHTASEVIASLVLGTLLSFGYMRLAASSAPQALGRWRVPLAVAAFVVAFSLKPALINHRLVDVALQLSGRERP